MQEVIHRSSPCVFRDDRTHGWLKVAVQQVGHPCLVLRDHVIGSGAVGGMSRLKILRGFPQSLQANVTFYQDWFAPNPSRFNSSHSGVCKLFKHTQTHRHTHKHTQTHTAHTDTHRHTQTHTDTHRHTHTQTHTDTHKHTQAHTDTHKHTQNTLR